jgi:hypothetical protein
MNSTKHKRRTRIDTDENHILHAPPPSNKKLGANSKASRFEKAVKRTIEGIFPQFAFQASLMK